ncbi:MAG: hypothetical protein QG628_7 [Patescibacteria group bacterium]|nr:hypothetical protein [Patescibacteria group bacterium]
MRINNFEEVLSWQKGKQLYILLSNDFKYEKDFSFKDQLMRAALSITNNIAEGFDRNSDKELKYFLVISRGSCAEVRSMLHIAYASKNLQKNRYEELTTLTTEISKLLTGFIKKLATDSNRLATD